VKLMNFGLAGLKSDPKVLGARTVAWRARQAQRRCRARTDFVTFAVRAIQHQTVDFRSEVILSARPCTLWLTAPPLRQKCASGPGDFGVPKAFAEFDRKHVAARSRSTSKDPVALAEMIRDCLLKIERRQVLTRGLGIPLATVTRRKSPTTLTPLAQVLRGILVFASLF